MQGVWIYILSGEQFKLTFENTQWRKVKTKATSVNTHHRRQAVLEDKCSPRVKEGKYGRQLCKNSFSCAGNWSTHTGDKPRPCAKCNKVLKNAACLRGHLLSHDVARTTLWAWLYFISSCTSEESVDITLVYEDDKTNWPTKSSFAFFVIYDQLEWKYFHSAQMEMARGPDGWRIPRLNFVFISI